MTRVLIDADGCPVVDEAVRLCGRFGVEYLILCDTPHHFEKVGVRMPIVSKGADSVDFTLISLLRPGDIAVTQDYGLTTMCMAHGARILNWNGMEYTAQSINAPLLVRHIAEKIRNAGGRLKGLRKHLPKQDQASYGKLARLLGKE